MFFWPLVSGGHKRPLSLLFPGLFLPALCQEAGVVSRAVNKRSLCSCGANPTQPEVPTSKPCVSFTKQMSFEIPGGEGGFEGESCPVQGEGVKGKKDA